MGRSTVDLAGRRFGRLVVIERAPEKGGHAKWLCRCDCGNMKAVGSHALRSGATQSCSCIHREMLVTRNTGQPPPPLSIRKPPEADKPRQARRTAQYKAAYHSWYCMIRRCTNPDDPAWERYGGRGITVCTEWLDFRNFLADMGEKPEGLTLERKNNDLGYSSDNCVWATPRQQSRNTRRFKLRPELILEMLLLEDDGLSVGDIARQVGYMENGTGIVLATAAALDALMKATGTHSVAAMIRASRRSSAQ